MAAKTLRMQNREGVETLAAERSISFGANETMSEGVVKIALSILRVDKDREAEMREVLHDCRGMKKVAKLCQKYQPRDDDGKSVHFKEKSWECLATIIKVSYTSRS